MCTPIATPGSGVMPIGRTQLTSILHQYFTRVPCQGHVLRRMRSMSEFRPVLAPFGLLSPLSFAADKRGSGEPSAAYAKWLERRRRGAERRAAFGTTAARDVWLYSNGQPRPSDTGPSARASRSGDRCVQGYSAHCAGWATAGVWALAHGVP